MVAAFMQLQRGIGPSRQLVGRGRARRPPETDSDHTGTISITVRVRRASWNAMKPRIQCVLTQWNSGFSASGSGTVWCRSD